MMTIDFLITTLIIVVSPGIGVLYTIATGLSRGAWAWRRCCTPAPSPSRR